MTLIGLIVEDAVKIYHYILFAVVLLLSALAKPSFIVAQLSRQKSEIFIMN